MTYLDLAVGRLPYGGATAVAMQYNNEKVMTSVLQATPPRARTNSTATPPMFTSTLPLRRDDAGRTQQYSTAVHPTNDDVPSDEDIEYILGGKEVPLSRETGSRWPPYPAPGMSLRGDRKSRFAQNT